MTTVPDRRAFEIALIEPEINIISASALAILAGMAIIYLLSGGDPGQLSGRA